MNILDEIINKKRTFVESLPELKKDEGEFNRKTHSLIDQLNNEFSIIYEYKRKTPSSGDLGNPPINVQLSRYVETGAKIVSVLTDEPYFGGTYSDLQIARNEFPELILLNKEFIISEKQIDYAKYYGADVILLIAKVLSKESIKAFYDYAYTIGLDVIVEVHDEEDVEKLSLIEPKIVGINNRNLEDFSVSLDVTHKLAKMFSSETHIISESGIHTTEDLKYIKDISSGALIGTAFMNGDLLNVI